jgi:pimeloyl-ACP methyl ester carboxylesterase
MSTAEAARDLDVLRRAVGDRRLTYLGFSYGSYLGNVYANMFPRRVRALAIDGVIDPIAWRGTRANLTTPQTTLLRSSEAGARALREILVRCRKAGANFCKLAAGEGPFRDYAKIVASLKRAPLVITDPNSGEQFVLDYPTLIAVLLSDLYLPFAAELVDADLSAVLELLQTSSTSGQAARDRTAARALVEKARALRAAERSHRAARADGARAFGFGFPYDNSREAFQTVLCTDGTNPRRARRWPAYADAADRTAPGFGRLWTWGSAPCASRTWTVRDEDSYRRGFRHRTVNPVLVVGNFWDPATNYKNAVKVASLLPHSRLLSSDSWGHTAYGTSTCVTHAITAYLVTRALPRAGTLCVGDVQPFTKPLGARSGAPSTFSNLPPVVPPLPGALPRG